MFPDRCFARPSMVLLILAVLLPAPLTAAAEPGIVYLSGTWFHRSDGVNLLDTPSGKRLAVDDAGRFIADSSMLPKNRHVKLVFDALHQQDGELYLARDRGNHGYDWFRAGNGEGGLAAPKELLERATDRVLFGTFGYQFDHDPMRGDAGVMVFADAGLAVTCARSQWDSRSFGISPFRVPGVTPAKKSRKPAIAIPIRTAVGGSVRAQDFPDRVFLDRPGKGFWYLGSRDGDDGRQLVLAFATPGRKANAGQALEDGSQTLEDGSPTLEDGSQTLAMTDPVAIGKAGAVKAEAGAVVGDHLFLLVARVNESIGGVDASRRLLRVRRADGAVTEAEVRFDCYLDAVRVAPWGPHLAVHSPTELRVVNGETLETRWRKTVSDLVPGDDAGYRVYRVGGDSDGTVLAVGLATPYRRPDEPTHVLTLRADGAVRKRYRLEPGSLDDLVCTDDGGVLVVSDRYTAKLGGTVDVAANEAAALARVATATGPATADGAGPAPKAVAPPAFAFPDGAVGARQRLWFDHPAKGFGGEALPLGNGHLGAMLTGGTDRANIVVNVDSMWEGTEHRMASYQGFAELSVTLNHDPKAVTDYRRELDLRTGVYRVSYRHGGVTYRREAFCSHPHGVLAVRFSADRPGACSGDVELMAMHPADFRKGSDGIDFHGKLTNGRRFGCVMKLATAGGTVDPKAGEDGVREVKYRRYRSTRPFNTVRVEGADSITLYLVGDTDYSLDPADRFRGADPAAKIAPRLAAIGKHSFEAMREASAADVATLFDRCMLDLATDNPDALSLPTDRRLAAYRRGDSDPAFEALAFAAQRYMMIACSRPGSLPANLQGLWNNSNWPAWTSDYHTDINIQMNYWFVEPANLPECAAPLFDYIESQIPIWRKRAKATFGETVRGWTVAYMNNIDGGMAYKIFPPGNVWLAWHYAEQFKFSQDRDYLERRAYPVLRELSEQWQDLLIERPDGLLTTPKTMSPEHKPQQFGISQDLQMVRNCFTDFIAASTRLDRDRAFRGQVRELRGRLIPIRIGRWGQLQEWERDRDSRYCTHRHIQHLFAAFPGSEISAGTPELARAAVTSLEARGRGRSGWSQVWRASIFARIGRPDLAYRQLRSALRGFHPHLIWQGKSQVDAPCGYAAGVCEMLLQSHCALDDSDSRYRIDLLPALPTAWPRGRIAGLRARGGFEVDIAWNDGALTRATIRNVGSPSQQCTVRYRDRQATLTIPRGEEASFE